MDKLLTALNNFCIKTSLALQKKREGLDGLIITIGLILIVLVVLFLFKDKILDAMNGTMNNIGNDINKVGQIGH
jgi:ubiquinone biosynthesis protein UbiJ